MKRALLFLLLVPVLWQCNTMSESGSEDLYDSIKSTDLDNPSAAGKLENQLRMYVMEHPDDTSNASFLFEAGQLNINPIQNYIKAIDLFETIGKDYPEHRLAPQALFTVGFIQEQYLQDAGKARKKFEEVIEKYPNSFWASQARDNMSLPDDESIMKMVDSLNRMEKGR